MSDSEDNKNEQEESDCLLEKWLMEENEPQEIPDNPEAFQKILDDAALKVNKELVEMLYANITGKSGYELFQTLRACHVAMASQLGLVEEWMRFEISRNLPHIDVAVVDAERGHMILDGNHHFHHHADLMDEDEDEDEEEKLVH